MQLCEGNGHGELGEVYLVLGGVEIGDRVAAVPRQEREGVRAGAAGEGVVASFVYDGVVVRSGVDGVVPGVAEDDVVALAALNGVVSLPPRILSFPAPP